VVARAGRRVGCGRPRENTQSIRRSADVDHRRGRKNGGSVSRNVLLMAVVGIAVVGGFVAVEVSGLADRLGALSWFSNGANVIQWVSGPATFGAIIAFGYRYFVRRCAVPLCI
jgi:hypothetical protein